MVKNGGCPNEDGFEDGFDDSADPLAEQAHDALVDGAAHIAQLQLTPQRRPHNRRAAQQWRDAGDEGGEGIWRHHGLVVLAEGLRVSVRPAPTISRIFWMKASISLVSHDRQMPKEAWLPSAPNRPW